jgi:hypothetical protein
VGAGAAAVLVGAVTARRAVLRAAMGMPGAGVPVVSVLRLEPEDVILFELADRPSQEELAALTWAMQQVFPGRRVVIVDSRRRFSVVRPSDARAVCPDCFGFGSYLTADIGRVGCPRGCPTMRHEEDL